MTTVARREHEQRQGGGGSGVADEVHDRGRRWAAVARARVGNPDGPPILVLHGSSENDLSWVGAVRQRALRRVPARRLRPTRTRHVRARPSPSTTPTAPLWADDVPAILGRLELTRPVLVGWSRTAFVICDFVRAYGAGPHRRDQLRRGHGQARRGVFGTLIGPGFLDHFVDVTADDLPTNIRAMRSFVGTCFVSRCRTTTSRRRCAGTLSCRRRSATCGPRDRLRRRAARTRVRCS